MKSGKLVLDTSAMQDDFFEDAALIGIATTLPAHRLCWLLNASFNLGFVRAVEMDVCLRSAREEDHQYFSVYQYVEPLNVGQHLLYRLRCGKQRLLPELKNLDFLWMVQSAQSETDAAIFTAHLRGMNEMQLANLLVPEDLKSRLNLLV